MNSVIDEEEKKKREKEFDQMFLNSSISKKANTNIFDNSNISNSDEYTKRANEFDLMFGNLVDMKFVQDKKLKEQQKKMEEQLQQTQNQNTQLIQENSKKAIDNSNVKNSSNSNNNSKERWNVIARGNKLSSLKTEEEIQQENAQKEFASRTDSDKNILSQLGKFFENFWLGGVNGLMQATKVATDVEYENKNQESTLLAGNNSNIPEVVTQEYKNQNNNSILDDKIKQQKVNEKFSLIRFTPEYQQINNTNSNIISEETKRRIDNDIKGYTNQYGEIELNPLQLKLEKSLNKNNQKIQNNVNEISNPAIKKLAEIAPSTSNSLVGAGLSTVNPMLGLSYFTASAMGNYEDSGRQMGMSKDEAKAYSRIMGIMESATEMVGIDKFIKGVKVGNISKLAKIKQTLKYYGMNVADNAIQEAIIDPIDEAVAFLASGKTKNDYSTPKGTSQLISDMIKDGIDGALSAMLMDAVGLGINSSVRVYNKITNNQLPTQQELTRAFQDINNDERIQIEDYFAKNFDYEKNRILDGNAGEYYSIDFDNDGNIVDMTKGQGTTIDYKGDANIAPVIMLINDNYNVIDANTGLKLDTTPYQTVQEAKTGFTEKIENSNSSTIQEINNRVNKAKLSIINTINQADVDITTGISNKQMYNREATIQLLNENGIDTSNIQNRSYLGKEINDIIRNPDSYVPTSTKNVINNNTTNNTQTSSEPNTSNFYDTTTNYAVQDIKKVTEPFDKQSEYTVEEMAEVWNNDISGKDYDISYDNNGNIKSYIAIEEEGNNIVVNQYDNNDNIVKSEVIPNNNGRYNASDIQDTINRVASLYDENRPIKGQRDIEGNEVKSMKKKTSNKVDEPNYTGTSNLSFSEQVDKWKKGEVGKNTHLIVLKHTPKLYQELGADNLPITIVANKLDRIYNEVGRQKGEYHGLGEKVKELPRAIENPLNIVLSTTQTDSLVIVTDLADNKDDIITVSLKLSGKGQVEIDDISRNINSNVLTSAYGRKNYDRQKQAINGSFEGWMEQNQKNGRIVYDIDEGIIKRPTKGQGLQLPNSESKSNTTKTQGSISTNSIPQNISNVKNNTVTNKFMQKNKKNTQNSKDDGVRAMKKNTLRGNINTTQTNITKNTKNNIINNLMYKIINNEKYTFNSNIKINTKVVDNVSTIPLNYKNAGQSTLSNLAKKLFGNLHKKVLNNKEEKIYVTNSDINESIAQTLKNPEQKSRLKDNIAVFSQLDKIIENAIEIKSSDTEIVDNKARTQYKDYKYYYTQAYIDGEQAWVQFDTRVQKGTTGKDERHFRLERIYKINETSSNGGTGNMPITHFSNEPASTNSISQNTKNVKNGNIRFAKKSAKTVKPEGEILEPGQTNAQRGSNYIEQEIRKIEKNGNWDDSIPVTKMTDIKRTIEDYLGIGVEKGHFRQHAYGIYKGGRDIIRTKELKDIDTILHEAGHALDIGKRLNIDKESISNELLTAVNNYGGYETESRQVQLEEGFAEVIREYAIVPEQAKIDYPQTVTVLEGIRQENKQFNDFISKVQQQTYNYIHQNPRNRVLSNQSIGERTDKPQWTKEYISQEIKRNIYDKDIALKDAVETLAKVKGKSSNDIRASENAYYLVRLTNGIGDKVTSMLSDGYIDEKGNKLMPGLNQLGEILGNNPQRFDDLRAYLVAQRDLEYKAKTLKTGIRTMDSKAVVEQFKNDTQIQEATRIVYDTLNGVLQYAVNNGLITQENAKNLRESNVFYVPMQRVLEGNKNNVGRRGAVSEIIKKRTGSELDVKDVFENIITNSSNIIQQVENNNILKALYNEGESTGLTGTIYDVIPPSMTKIGTAKLSTWENELKNQGVDVSNIDFNKTIDLFAPNNKIDSQNLITSFIDNNGKRVYLQFKDEVLFNSIMNMDKKFMSSVLNINRKLNMPLRYGATMANIGFAIPNMISDTAQAAIYSEAGFIPVVDNIIGIMDILSVQNKAARNFFNKVMPGYADRINTLYAIYSQTGSTSATRLSQYRENTQNIMKDIYGTKNNEVLGIKEKYKPLKRLLDVLTYVPELSEQSTRFRVFEKNLEYYRNKGMAETDARIKAALQSRDATQDFGRTGNLTREINQLIPFSAARVGSAYTFAEKVKSNPKQVAMRTAVLLTISTIIKAIGYDDKEIEELNQRKKDDNFVLKVGNQIVTIKKPQGILRSIINLGEYVQDLFTGHIEEGKEGERLVQWTQNAIMDNMPADSVTGLVPNMIAPVVENTINKDLYYNSDIVKSYDLELPDSEQYYDYNSQLAIWLGKAFNYSPAKIDNLISGYFGGLGTQVTNIIDFIAGKTGIAVEQPEMGAEDNAIGKRFIVNVNSNSASLDEIYNLKTDLTKKKNGGTITSKETEQLETITNAISEISKLNKQIREIKADTEMSGKEKAEQIKLLQQQKTDTARQALGKDLIYAENQSKIESTKLYPSRDTLTQNGRTLTMTAEMKKEYEQVANEYYNKYAKQGLYSKEKLEQIKDKSKDYAKKYMLKKYKNQLEE